MHAERRDRLWSIAQYVLNVLEALFGLPADVAAQHMFLRKEHALMLSWLRCAEALVRRILLLEARRFALAAPPPPGARRAGKPRTRTLMAFSPDDPQAWRVGFRLFESTPHDMAPMQPMRPMAPMGPMRPYGAGRFASSWPLAERYEALLRACADPTPHARRLARRLARAPQRLDAALAAPPEADDRIEDFAVIGAEARAAWRNADTS